MIELKHIDTEIANTLTRNMESFFITYRSPTFLSPLVKQLTEEFGKEYDSEIKTVLTALTKAKRYGASGSMITLNRNHYIKAATRTKKVICNKKMKQLLLLLDESNYIELLLGYYINSNESRTTCMVTKPKLLTILDNLNCKLAMSRKENQELIEVVDVDKTTITKKNINGNLVKSKKIVFKETRYIRGIKAVRGAVVDYNDVIENSLITIDGVVVNSIVYKRRFEDTLDLCGRYYCGSFQTEKSKLRHTITINGKPTCEVDYANIQPRCLATELGITVDYDPYEVDLDGVTRKFIKRCFMSVLFSSSRGGAKSSITNKLKKESIEGVTAEDVVLAIEKRNISIASEFYTKSNYQKLQNYDARMAEFIINHFTSKDVPVLCYHDSFVVQSEYKAELIDVMYAAWEHILGNTDNCNVDIEFDSSIVEAPVEVIEEEDTLSSTVHPTWAYIPLECYFEVFIEHIPSEEYKHCKSLIPLNSSNMDGSRIDEYDEYDEDVCPF